MACVRIDEGGMIALDEYSKGGTRTYFYDHTAGLSDLYGKLIARQRPDAEQIKLLAKCRQQASEGSVLDWLDEAIDADDKAAELLVAELSKSEISNTDARNFLACGLRASDMWAVVLMLDKVDRFIQAHPMHYDSKWTNHKGEGPRPLPTKE